MYLSAHMLTVLPSFASTHPFPHYPSVEVKRAATNKGVQPQSSKHGDGGTSYIHTPNKSPRMHFKYMSNVHYVHAERLCLVC